MKLIICFVILFLGCSFASHIFRDFCPQILDQDDNEYTIENYQPIVLRYSNFATSNNITIINVETLFIPFEVILDNGIENNVPIAYDDVVGVAKWRSNGGGSRIHSSTKREHVVQCFRLHYIFNDPDEFNDRIVELPNEVETISPGSIITPPVALLLLFLTTSLL